MDRGGYVALRTFIGSLVGRGGLKKELGILYVRLR
jgi:hypothetical protein